VSPDFDLPDEGEVKQSKNNKNDKLSSKAVIEGIYTDF